MTTTCSRCGSSALFLAHDAGRDGHGWQGKSEAACPCGPELICAVCDGERLRGSGFVLLERAPLPRALYNGAGLIH